MTRAPRLPGERDGRDRLHLAPPVLQGALVAFVSRDTRGLALERAQRLTHFAATPMVCLSWFQGFTAGNVERTPDGPRWTPLGAAIVLSGTQSQPTVGWSPGGGRMGMACLEADVARQLFGLELGTINDRIVAAHTALAPCWWPLLDALLAAPDDAATLTVLTRHLAAPWQACRSRPAAHPSLRQIGRHWVERLAWQAREWAHGHSARQVERRIKAYSGRSLRQWQSLVKTEGVFFRARDRFEAGQPFDWAALAAEEGFADQAHLSRTAKRITGFSPSDFALRFAEDESFWLYRLWV